MDAARNPWGFNVYLPILTGVRIALGLKVHIKSALTTILKTKY